MQRSRPKDIKPKWRLPTRLKALTRLWKCVAGLMVCIPAKSQVIIEEIKTTTLSLELINEEHNRLHWAQAKCYAYMYARQHDLSGVSIHLTYYHLDSRKEKTFERHFTLAELETFFCDLITPYLDWFEKVYAWEIQAGSINSTARIPLC